MNENICLCGAMAGYPHQADCPFPYFGHDLKREEMWIEQKKRGEKKMNAIYFDRGTGFWEIAYQEEIEKWIAEPGNISVDQLSVEFVDESIDLVAERDKRNRDADQ